MFLLTFSPKATIFLGSFLPLFDGFFFLQIQEEKPVKQLRRRKQNSMFGLILLTVFFTLRTYIKGDPAIIGYQEATAFLLGWYVIVTAIAACFTLIIPAFLALLGKTAQEERLLREVERITRLLKLGLLMGKSKIEIIFKQILNALLFVGGTMALRTAMAGATQLTDLNREWLYVGAFLILGGIVINVRGAIIEIRRTTDLGGMHTQGGAVGSFSSFKRRKYN